MTSKKKSSAYTGVPSLFHQEVLKFARESFPEDCFDIQYDSAESDADVRISGYKLCDYFTKMYIDNSWTIPAIKECMHFSIVQEMNPDARSEFNTNFWVTIHTFQPCEAAAADGQIQSLMEKMIHFMQMLEEASPGEFRLKLDRDIPSTRDDNQIDGINMRALYTLAMGQTRLNRLGIHSQPTFDSNYSRFNIFLNKPIVLQGGADIVKSLHAYKKMLQVDYPFHTGNVFRGIYARIRFLNDELNKGSAVDEVEIDFYRKIIGTQAKEVEKDFPSDSVHMLTMQRQRAPEPEDEIAAPVIKTPTTPAQRLSRPYYLSAFPTPAEERESIRLEVKSRRTQQTLLVQRGHLPTGHLV